MTYIRGQEGFKMSGYEIEKPMTLEEFQEQCQDVCDLFTGCDLSGVFGCYEWYLRDEKSRGK